MERKAVVWISTILYTMISLAIIGLLLTVIQPKISQMRDSIIIDQTKSSFVQLNNAIQNTKGAPGTKIPSEFKLGKGQLTFSGLRNEIVWVYDSKYQPSEINRTIQEGIFYIKTEKGPDAFRVSIIMNYTDVNLTVDGIKKDKSIQAAPTAYKIWFENRDVNIDTTIE